MAKVDLLLLGKMVRFENFASLEMVARTTTTWGHTTEGSFGDGLSVADCYFSDC